MSPTALTPAQQDACDGLLDLGGERPTFRTDLARELHTRLTEATTSIAERLELTGQTLWLDKRALAGAHGCELRYHTDRAQGFPGWSPAMARGAIVHRAIQLAPFVSGPSTPLEVVDEAMARIAHDGDDRSPAIWLRTASPGEVAELRAEATEVVTKFDECFPPIVAKWRPRVEATVRHDLHGGTITLGSRPDLALGKADGHQARVLIVDFKTGQRYHGHGDDLRFCALVETLRLGVPPFRIATYYLDAARWDHEDVNEDVLELAVRRTIDGCVKLAQVLLNEREPSLSPGPLCNYCVLRHECAGAQQWAETAASLNP
ncbi:MAG TPA: PD-(D/E)XK nuclease family protein [Acidimicrobiales bacterium]|nr:PD-(D/E)XK nuclease family protein [Acidimicrobiales bacterium]